MCNLCFGQMRQVYHHCATAARDAGQKEKETMYKRKSLAAAGAISKLLEATQKGHFEKEEREAAENARKMAQLNRMMRAFASPTA